MEPTFKIILDRVHPKKDGTLPVRIRVYQGRKYKEQSLGISIPELDWNEQLQLVHRTNPSYKVYNSKISLVKAKIQKSIFLNEDEEIIITPEEVINQIGSKRTTKAVEVSPDIFEYGKAHIAKLQTTGHIGNSIVHSCAINKLKEFAGCEKLTFAQVNYSYLESFNTALLNEGMKVNGIANYLRTIRAIFNKAIKEGIISADLYPFSKFQIKHEKTINRTLTLAEVRSIVSLDLKSETTIWHHRNLFLLSYCLMGINFSDLLTLTRENFTDGRIVFRRRKTHKVYSILIHSKAIEIFNYYMSNEKGDLKDYILPFIVNRKNPTQLKKDVLQAIKNTNDYLGKIAKLCEIEKPITTYYARYTWANVARGLGFSKDIIAEGLGHEYGNKVTGIYLDNYSNSVIDEMNNKIIEASFSTNQS